MAKARVGIIGASGYTGSELVRILSRHDGVEIAMITSETHAGKAISDLHPQLLGACDQTLVSADTLDNDLPDVVFLALPHGVSMRFVQKLADKPVKIVDLSGDFRLGAQATYEKWYDLPHCCPEQIEQAVFGMPELFRDQVKGATLIANPGCYPTSVILPLAPLLKEGLIEVDDIIADSKSGVTGAGAKAKAATHFPSVNDSFKAYGLLTHRHRPEIGEVLGRIAESAVNVLFTPHLVPMNRGILSTIYARAKSGVTAEKIKAALKTAYAEEPFVRLRDVPPTTQGVRGSNFCDIHSTFDKATGRVLIVSAIDNLVKGAAGQAVQNMNLMLGFDERAGLDIVPTAP